MISALRNPVVHLRAIDQFLHFARHAAGWIDVMKGLEAVSRHTTANDRSADEADASPAEVNETRRHGCCNIQSASFPNERGDLVEVHG